MEKSPKGTVRISPLRGRLRLQLPREIYRGKQIYFSLGLTDTPENRAIAAEKAAQIQKDIAWGEFDPTLDKYRRASFDPPKNYKIGEIFEAYSAHKFPQIAKSSRRNFTTVAARLEKFKSARLDDAPKLKNWLLENYSADAVRRTIAKLSAACNWAIEEGMIEVNPFEGMRVTVPKKRKINPFSMAEQEAIIEAFQQSGTSSHYAGFVEFLFRTGCRPSEAVALRWENVEHLAYAINFSEAYVEGQRKSTKTNESRRFLCNESLQSLLKGIFYKQHGHYELVFPNPVNKEIDSGNFTRRHWRKILKELGIAHRGPYNCRHTFITLMLNEGVPVQDIAYWVGNSPQIIFNHYAGLTRSEVPEL